MIILYILYVLYDVYIIECRELFFSFYLINEQLIEDNFNVIIIYLKYFDGYIYSYDVWYSYIKRLFMMIVFIIFY